MPRRQTAEDWETRIREISDTVENDAVPESFVRWCMSMVYGEMWSEVSLGAQRRYFETSTTITADGSPSYDEPEDHFATVRVCRVDADGRELELTELRQGEEAACKGVAEGEAAAWTHVDDQLFLYPTPSSGDYKWYYQQQPTDLSSYADGDIIDVVVPAGEAFFVWGVAAMIHGRLKQDASYALQMKEQARTQLQFQAANRNASETRTRGPVVYDDDDIIRPKGWE